MIPHLVLSLKWSVILLHKDNMDLLPSLELSTLTRFVCKTNKNVSTTLSTFRSKSTKQGLLSHLMAFWEWPETSPSCLALTQPIKQSGHSLSMLLLLINWSQLDSFHSALAQPTPRLLLTSVHHKQALWVIQMTLEIFMLKMTFSGRHTVKVLLLRTHQWITTTATTMARWYTQFSTLGHLACLSHQITTTR